MVRDEKHGTPGTGTYMNLGGGGGCTGLQFCGQEGGGGDGGGGGGGDGGGGGGGDRQGGGGGGGSCSTQVFPQGHDPHLISVSAGGGNTGWSNFLEDVMASSTEYENEMNIRNNTIF
ncbi:hypothetical protein CR513_50043, partial [Mucuna pruriens]